MSSLPQKSIKGAVFKTWAISSIDKLIDYLSGTFIRGGKGISVRRSAGVTIIELEKQPEQVQQNATGGGGGSTNQDISASVSGSTAFVTLSDSTSAVEFVGTGDVTISGNTNGQIEINVTGGTGGGGGGGSAVIGMPDYANPLVTQVNYNTAYPGTAYSEQDVWLIGSLNTVFDPNDYSLEGHVEIVISNGTVSNTILLQDIYTNTSSNSHEIETPVMFPIPKGFTFELVHGTSTPGLGVKIYPCVGQSPTPLADYTVTRASGNTNGTLFYGLSQQGDNTVSIDSSLDGTPLDFEGASVL